MQDIEYLDHLDDAQQLARERHRPIAIVPLGQGMNTNDCWCPAASATRGLALSDPMVAALLRDRFVPVRFSMWDLGPGTDIRGRDFVLSLKQYPYPGVILTDPELNVLDKTLAVLSARDTADTLRRVLNARPDLAPEGADPDEPLYDLSDPAQVEFVGLVDRFDRATAFSADAGPHGESPRQVAMTGLIPGLTGWLAAHGARLPDVAAVGKALLGDAHYIVREYLRAEELWTEVIERHASHPIRHRCSFNRYDKSAWPETTHPALRGCARPGVETYAPFVPFPEVRARNLARVAEDPRYVRSPSGLVFARIPAGTFTMGGSPAIHEVELPLRRVTLSRPYLLAAWPVTRAQWRQFDESAYPGIESEGLAGDLPVTLVSANRAREYCRWLSARDGWHYRLPTEAEWERAARGGLEGKRYPWGDEPLDDTRANYSLPRPVPVASYEPNAYGLFEMVGNVAEFCHDRYHRKAYSMTPLEVTDPQGPTPEQQPRDMTSARASLSGSPFAEVLAYVSWRAGNDSDRPTGAFGFRVAADLPAV